MPLSTADFTRNSPAEGVGTGVGVGSGVGVGVAVGGTVLNQTLLALESPLVLSFDLTHPRRTYQNTNLAKLNKSNKKMPVGFKVPCGVLDGGVFVDGDIHIIR